MKFVAVAMLMIVACVAFEATYEQVQGGGVRKSATNLLGQSGCCLATTNASQAVGFVMARTSGTVITTLPNCSVSFPCNFEYGTNTVASFITSPTATITGGIGGDTLYLYVSNAGVLTAGFNNLTISCSGVLACLSGITAFPSGSVPLGKWTASSATWNTSGGSNTLPLAGTSNVTAGTGCSVIDSGTSWQISCTGGSGTSGPCALASSLGFLLNDTDETTLLNSTIASFIASPQGGGCLAIDSGKTLGAFGQIVIGNTGGTYPSCGGGNIRITGGGGGNGFSGISTLDLRYSGSGITDYKGGPKLLDVGFGTLEIDHISVTSNAGGSDCAAFILVTNPHLSFHNGSIYGSNSVEASSCNDAIIAGGTGASGSSCLVTAIASGVANNIDSNRFQNVSNAYWARAGANADVFSNNRIQGANSVSPNAAMLIKPPNNGARGTTISKNVIELDGSNYLCGIALGGGGANVTGTMMDGNGFWDGGGASADYCLSSGVVAPQVLSSFNDVTGSSVTSGNWPVGANLIGLGPSNVSGGPTVQTETSPWFGTPTTTDRTTLGLTTTFQNLTGKNIYVYVTVTQTGNNSEVTAYTDATSTPTFAVADTYVATTPGVPPSTGSMNVPFSFVVFPGNYYRVVVQAGTVSVLAWVELN